MLSIHTVTRPRYKVQRSPRLKPKYSIGQRVEVRLVADNEVFVDRGVVQGFAYLSPNYQCQSHGGFSPSSGFSYQVLFGGGATDLVNEAELFLTEAALCTEEERLCEPD